MADLRCGWLKKCFRDGVCWWRWVGFSSSFIFFEKERVVFFIAERVLVCVAEKKSGKGVEGW